MGHQAGERDPNALETGGISSDPGGTCRGQGWPLVGPMARRRSQPWSHGNLQRWCTYCVLDPGQESPMRVLVHPLTHGDEGLLLTPFCTRGSEGPESLTFAQGYRAKKWQN